MAKIKGISMDFFTFFVFLFKNNVMKTILWPMFTLQFKTLFNCHHLEPKLARFGCLAKNSRIKVSWSFAHIWWKNQNSCLWFSLTIFHRWNLQMSNKYQQIEKCCPVLMFSSVYFYDFCERQNHCPKSKNYHFGNTGTERLSLNGNPRVKYKKHEMRQNYEQSFQKILSIVYAYHRVR